MGLKESIIRKLGGTAGPETPAPVNAEELTAARTKAIAAQHDLLKAQILEGEAYKAAFKDNSKEAADTLEQAREVMLAAEEAAAVAVDELADAKLNALPIKLKKPINWGLPAVLAGILGYSLYLGYIVQLYGENAPSLVISILLAFGMVCYTFGFFTPDLKLLLRQLSGHRLRRVFILDAGAIKQRVISMSKESSTYELPGMGTKNFDDSMPLRSGMLPTLKTNLIFSDHIDPVDVTTPGKLGFKVDANTKTSLQYQRELKLAVMAGKIEDKKTALFNIAVGGLTFGALLGLAVLASVLIDAWNKGAV